MRKIVIFASGTGSNARKIVEYFKKHPTISVEMILSNNAQAGVLEMAQSHKIPTRVFSREEFKKSETILNLLKKINPDLIALAGFLWLVPKNLVQAFPNKIVNIHPALLHKFGGKGMYGMHVHKAVHEAGEKESGPTIHYVNEHFDEGEIIFQARVGLTPEDSPADIGTKVLQLEHEHFPKVIERLLGKE